MLELLEMWGGNVGGLNDGVRARSTSTTPTQDAKRAIKKPSDPRMTRAELEAMLDERQLIQINLICRFLQLYLYFVLP